MPEKGGSTKRTRVHSKDRDYTLYTQKRSPFTILAPVGRYNETLLGKLAQDFLQKPGYLAVDLSKLDAVSLPLIRALCDYAAGLEKGVGRMVLLRPPDKIMGLVRLVGRLDKLPVVLSEAELEGELELLDDRIRRAHERVRLVKTMLQSNPCWQLVDPNASWLCPFCVTFRPEIQFVAQGSPSQQVVEGIATHLARECTTYSDGQTDGWPFEVLERVVNHAAAEHAHDEGKILEGPTSASADAIVEGTDLGEVDERRRRLLPTAAPSIPKCDLEVCYRAAEFISGDFYDFVRLSDRRVALVVGDVSGTGIDPGVLMGMARKTLSIRLRDHEDPGEALARANDDLCSELEGESFATAVVAVIDGEKRKVTVARAGHTAPFLLRAGSKTVERIECAGPVLGLVPTAALEQGMEVRSLKLKEGDVLVLYSDGLESMKNDGGESFGPDRIAAILRSNTHREANLILGAVIVEAEQFSLGTDREEDITAICARFL